MGYFCFADIHLCVLFHSSWGLPGWHDRELHCSDSGWNCPACSHSNRCAGLFHREKEKHGCWLPVFLVRPAWFDLAASPSPCKHVSLLFITPLTSCVKKIVGSFGTDLICMRKRLRTAKQLQSTQMRVQHGASVPTYPTIPPRTPLFPPFCTC